MEMIERVSAALEAAFEREWRVFDAGQADDLARVAIEAMREPTDAQITAFSRACDTNGQCLVKYGYTAMIDAALSRPTPEHKEE